MKYNVFISHSSKDEDEVNKICKYLEENGIKCFVSYRDIPSGVSYPGEITRAMRESEMLLLVLTQNSNESTQVDKEITMANDQRKKLACFRLEDIQYSDDKAYLMSGVNWLDAFANPNECYFELLQDVCMHLGMPIPNKETEENEEELKRYRLGDLLIEASSGNGEAMFLLGQTYKWGWYGIPCDDEIAARWYHKAAEKGHPIAMNNLGVMYQYGNGVEQSISESLIYYKRAAHFGDTMAQCSIGRIYYYGENGMEINYTEAIKWFSLSANAGYSAAQNMLAWCYYEGNGVEKDEQKAVEFFRLAAEQDNDEAQYWLSECYRIGVGVPKDESSRLVWLTKAADSGHESAIIDLSDYYGEHDEAEKSFLLDQKLAEKGCSIGYWRLFCDYRDGIGCEANKEKAIEYLSLSAEWENGNAQDILGDFYLDGNEEFGINADIKKAAYWYERAVGNENSDAMVDLGNMYGPYGLLPTDKKKSFELIKHAAELEDVRGQYLTATNYFEGYGVECNDCEAFYWMKLAAERSEVPRYWAALGMYYYYGTGCEQDFISAVLWLEKSVEKEYYADADTLAACYEFGYGVDTNKQKAIELYQKVLEAAESDSSIVTNMAHEALIRLGVEKES